MNREDMQRANWTLHREYKDEQGNVYVEYSDPQGRIHTYSNGSHDGQLIEEVQQNQADRNISKGILIGVIVAVVGSLSAGAIYMLTRPNVPEPAAILVPNYSQTPNFPIQSPSVTVVTIPQPSGEPSSSTVHNQALVTPKPATPISPIETTSPNATVLTPGQVDMNLKNAALKKLQATFPNNQLLVEVNDTNIIISGTTETSGQREKIQSILSVIHGVGTIRVDVTVKPTM